MFIACSKKIHREHLPMQNSVMHNPIHPGELLRKWIEGANLTVTQLAEHIGVNRTALSRIINGRTGVTADMDLRLHQALGTREGLWLDLQTQHDLWIAKQADALRLQRLVFSEPSKA